MMIEDHKINSLQTDDFGFVFRSENENLQNDNPRKNDYYTLIIGISGATDVTIGHHSFTLRPKTISIISPNLIYSLDNITEDLSVLQILFKKDFLYKTHIKEQIIDDLLYLNPEYPPFYPLEEAYPSVLSKFRMIEEEQKKNGPFYFNIIRLILMELLYDYNRACEYCLLGFKKGMNRQYQLTYQFKQMVDIEFIKMRALTDYASSLGVTAKHLSEVVKEETGLTALGIIHERLLLESQYLLKHSILPIKEIAYHLQFDTVSHFSRFFKAKMNSTPLKYRNNP